MKINPTGQASSVETNNKYVTIDEIKEQNNKDYRKNNDSNFKKEDVYQEVEKLNETIQGIYEEDYRKDLQFEIHEESQRMMVKIVNVEQNEVIKELPPEEILDMIGKIKEMVGLLIDEKI
jgi:flagellar protein FlaG